jgi:hypothetical protein
MEKVEEVAGVSFFAEEFEGCVTKDVSTSKYLATGKGNDS